VKHPCSAASTSDHDEFRKTIRSFLERAVVPEYDDWYAAGAVPREMYLELGESGVFGIEVPEEYGGRGSRPTSTPP
jgi:alkylation response protein AidB-like acyl-CoA dehydrogenase